MLMPALIKYFPLAIQMSLDPVTRLLMLIKKFGWWKSRRRIDKCQWRWHVIPISFPGRGMVFGSKFWRYSEWYLVLVII